MESRIEWGVVSAADVGALHRRERIWILANAKHRGIQERRGVVDAFQESREPSRVFGNVGSCMQQQEGKILANSASTGQPGSRKQINASNQAPNGKREAGDAFNVRQFREWPPESGILRVANGVANRANRIKAIGNGQVPLCAATAWRLLANI